MFFDTREPAPLSVRWARVIAPLVMCFAYTVFRVGPAVHERIPLSELLSAGVMFAGLVLVAFLALGDLLVPRLGREIEPARYTDGARPGWGAFAGELPVQTMTPVAADEALTEELFTHEYVPQHHTPARGFALPQGFRLVGDHGEGIELDPFGQRVGGGRHRLKADR